MAGPFCPRPPFRCSESLDVQMFSWSFELELEKGIVCFFMINHVEHVETGSWSFELELEI